MDSQKSQSKLTRTKSSLLRSSPTVRSSIRSFSSVTEENVIMSQNQLEDDEKKRIKPWKSGTKTGSTRFITVLAMFVVTLCSFFVFSYLRRREIPTSENLLLALIFIAVTLYFARKIRKLINQICTILKQIWFDNSNRAGLLSMNAKPVQWFIGDSKANKCRNEKKMIIREGVEFYSNGDYYEGEFHKEKCNGSGVYNYFVNGRYEGDWIDGKYDGYGIESWARGSRYRGQYRQGLRHGYGVYKFYTGDSYAGEWCNGQSHGIGLQNCADGSCYSGQFKCGLKHGFGCYHFRNGDRYAGEYFGDIIHGFGVYHFANGHCYEGAWHEGRKQGYGMYTFRKSDTKCGEWDSGTLKIPLPPVTDAIVQAVQAARRAAQSAIHLCRVDEQVNKTVAAANRASTAARVAAIKAVQNQMEDEFCDIHI